MTDDKIVGANGSADPETYLEAAASVVRNARVAAARSVNLAMTYAYFEVGRIVVEEEQSSNERAEYGKQVVSNVSARLTDESGRGFSTTNTKQMRQFSRVYPSDRIGQKVSDGLGAILPVATTGRKFFLSWSHYLKLMRMDDEGERHFYEIEAARTTGAWRSCSGSSTAASTSGWR